MPLGLDHPSIFKLYEIMFKEMIINIPNTKNWNTKTMTMMYIWAPERDFAKAYWEKKCVERTTLKNAMCVYHAALLNVST